MSTATRATFLCCRNASKFYGSTRSYSSSHNSSSSSSNFFLASVQPRISCFGKLSPKLSAGFKPPVPLTNNALSKLYMSTKVTDINKSTGGLADQIMASKIAETQEKKGSEQNSGGGGEEEPKKEPPPKMGKWQKYGMIAGGVCMGGLTIANAVLFSLPDRDEMGNDIEDEFSPLPFPSQHYNRLKDKIFTTKKAIEEPFSDKLLPDPLEPPYIVPKYTIVLELTGLLVHATWTHKYGWRFQKRPGLDMFMAQVGFPNFELVIWTVENAMTFFPIINGMDPQGQHIMYRLFKDATHYVDGHHVKNLDALNRDLGKVIVIDWDKNTTKAHPQNTLTLKKWKGDNSDRSLIGLAQLLHAISDSDVDDVRDILAYYQQFEDPIEAFRENQRKLQEEMQLEEERKKKELSSGSKFSSFSGLSSLGRFRR